MKDQKLDTLLRGWEVQPPPALSGSGAQGDGAWDESAATILEKALAAPSRSSGAEIDSLLAAPSLEIEPGEPSQKSAGEKKMSDDRDPPSAARPSVRAGRPSLKELAERVSKTPPPPSVRAPEPAPVTKASPPVSSPERISALPPSVRAPSAPISITHVEPVPSIAKTAPVEAAAVAVAANDASPAVSKSPQTLAAGTAPKKSSSALWIGIGGGVVALAAAASIAFYLNSKKTPAADQTVAAKPKTDVAATAEVMTAAPAVTKDDAAPEVVQNDPPPSGVDLDSIGDATDSASPSFTGRLPVGSSAPIATNDETDETDETKDGPHRVEPNGTLDEAMRDAAGPADENKGQPASTPAGPKNLPDTPPNGSVSAAIGSVRGAARGCVAGADKDSSATIVFGSSGAVQSVSVGGWAAGKPAAGCIQGAVSGARVEPFTKPSFPVTMTIRP